MPNNCNSITKIILICCWVFLAACSSISPSISSEKSYIGKFYFSQNKQNSNFIIRIKTFPDEIIIQVSKPLLGNLMNIRLNHTHGFTYFPEKNEFFQLLFQYYSEKEYFNFLSSCFYNLNSRQNVFSIKKNKVELRCELKKENDIEFYIASINDFVINGVLKNEKY